MNEDKEVYTYNEVDKIIDEHIISPMKGQLMFSLSVIILGIACVFFVASIHILVEDIPMNMYSILYSTATFGFIFGTISTGISLIIALKYIKVKKFW